MINMNHVLYFLIVCIKLQKGLLKEQIFIYILIVTITDWGVPITIVYDSVKNLHPAVPAFTPL